MTLTKGKKYNVRALKLQGWTKGDGSGHEGYNVADYFEADGTYRGPDQHGIEPIFWPATLYDYATGKALRDATGAELAESIAAGPEGVIEVDGISCYVQE